MLQVSNVPKGGAMSNEDGEVMVDPEAANTNIHEKEGGYGKKRFSRPVVAAAICLLVLLIVGILLVVLDFTVGLTKSNDKSYQNDETHGNQGSEEHDEYYSSKCPEEFAMIYPEWHSNQDIDCSCDFTEYEGDCCVFDNENERLCGCGLSVLRCTSCEMCSTPDLCYSFSLEASYERKPDEDWPDDTTFNSTLCMTTNQIPLMESWYNYTLVPLKEPSTLCVTLTDHWILTKNFDGFSSCTSASLDGRECDECSKSICQTDDERLKSVRVYCGYPDHIWRTCVASDRLPHPHHPWFNRIRDELIDDQSIARTYPPWGNGTCVKE